MKIPPLSNNSPLPGRRNTPEAATPAHIERPDVIIHGRLASLSGDLEAIPAIRPDAVALGRSLAADPNYPGPIIIDQLAQMFVADAMK
jgi:hypothetical protein